MDWKAKRGFVFKKNLTTKWEVTASLNHDLNFSQEKKQLINKGESVGGDLGIWDYDFLRISQPLDIQNISSFFFVYVFNFINC